MATKGFKLYLTAVLSVDFKGCGRLRRKEKAANFRILESSKQESDILIEQCSPWAKGGNEPFAGNHLFLFIRLANVPCSQSESISQRRVLSCSDC